MLGRVPKKRPPDVPAAWSGISMCRFVRRPGLLSLLVLPEALRLLDVRL